MNAKQIRCVNDLELYRSLCEDRLVKRVSEEIERAEDGSGPSTRRHLLATSVRLDRSMAEPLHTMADHCVGRLGIDTPLELYAYNSPQFNAACFKPEAGRVFIMFSSGLLEAFQDDELLFVMGHELGHHVYDHHAVPIGYLLRGREQPSAELALQLFAWSRYAEISADRAGAFCAQNKSAVARALFKLASGLTDDRVVRFDLDNFLSQVDDMTVVDGEPGQGAPTQDWFSTHPFSPLRVKALVYFERSVLMRDGGTTKEDLELSVQEAMSLMEPSYIKGTTAEAKAMRDLLVAGAMVVATADGELAADETTVLKKFFDDELDVGKLNPERLRQMLPARIAAVKSQASVTRRMQVMRDLCVVARADSEITAAELQVLRDICRSLDVPCGFVLHRLEEPVELD